MKIHVKSELGKIGEQIATEYVEKLGYKIIKRNFFCKHGEIDIIAQDNQEIVFIEVKTRSSTNFGKPSEAVNKIKLMHMYKTAKYYLYKFGIYKSEIQLLKIVLLLEVFQSLISGIDTNDKHPSNISLILVTLEVSHFDISGKDIKEEHPLKVYRILIIFLVFHLDISGK